MRREIETVPAVTDTGTVKWNDAADHSGSKLCHGVGFFIFVDHFRMLLFLCLNVVQELADLTGTEVEEIGVVVAGYHFFVSDAVGAEQSVMLLISLIGGCRIGCLGLVRVYAGGGRSRGDGRDFSIHQLTERLEVLLLVFGNLGE